MVNLIEVLCSIVAGILLIAFTLVMNVVLILSMFIMPVMVWYLIFKIF